MKNLDTDVKKEIDEQTAAGIYAAGKIIPRIIIAVIILTVLGGICRVGYTRTFGKADREAKREVFKESTTYNEAAASFLAKSYKEYNEAESDEDKDAIAEYVIMSYPNLDTENIENDTLRRFYIQCLNN